MNKYLVFIEQKPTFTLGIVPERLNELLQKKILIATRYNDDRGGTFLLKISSLDKDHNKINEDSLYGVNDFIYLIKEWNVHRLIV